MSSVLMELTSFSKASLYSSRFCSHSRFKDCGVDETVQKYCDCRIKLGVETARTSISASESCL